MIAMHALDALTTDLSRLQAAMDAGELEAMPELLDDYSRRLHALCAEIDVAAHRSRLQQLHDGQLQLMDAMRRHQAHLLELMRAQRQSGRAATAYMRTEPE